MSTPLNPGIVMPDRLNAFDTLRGIGILGVLFLHFSLYNHAGILDMDMSNPPLIIKIIGFALMWASLFAVVSAAVLVWSVASHGKKLQTPAEWSGLGRRKLLGGLLVLAVAYLYFLVLGPGIFDFSAKTVDRSMLVGLVVNGSLALPTMERVLYVDSLVMIGLNLLILTPLVVWLVRRKWFDALFLVSVAGALLFLALGLARIPLFALYEDLVREGSALVFPFNFVVNKNNPLLPFLGFGFLGMATGSALLDPGRFKSTLVAILGALLLVGGVAAYILLPDTMLKRSIDETWFCIMIIQAGFLTLVVLAAGRLSLKKSRKAPELSATPAGGAGGGLLSFVRGTGRVSLTVFMAEPVLTALGGKLFGLVAPGWNEGIYTTLVGGLVYVLLWIPFLMLWKHGGYRFGFEWLFDKILSLTGQAGNRWPIHRG